MGETGNNITIKISPREADVFQALRECNALDIKYGKVIMNFAGGVLQNIVKEEMIMKR